MSEPYLPDREEVEASGAADWVDQALQHHQKKQDSLSRLLGGEKESLRRERDALADAFSRADEDDDVDRGPDLFSKERNQAQKARQSLASMFGEEKNAKLQEQDELRNMFGSAPSSKNPKKKGR
jgi:hypothetical protein